MAKAIPKWVMERLSRLWKKYGDSQAITFKQIKDVLKMDDENTIRVFINELKKADWIEVQLSPESSRERIYILKEPNKIMMEIVSNGNKRSKG
ncbi:MAG: hypothetical protein IB618_00855 [Candidatus Pacearchaeota archaeon]|nr:MAG: hypothetical protein IB618_00855 [Candidatus Pacearchaeota archaeon]